ncbi:hypothetical protein NQ314_008970 [Rhamnusium bicolor]|uniref:Uncharacterized protein n=1 Tax=Rhamnusium bicolor TaxID=1586634 RepID=A0AAV8Y5B5_9CUCU|nr:hypothetical protein NQ314_008970 [Rhamnusium bicolor]
MEPEDKIIEKIEKHPDLKNIADPMPPFESVEQRLIHLSEKKLHPLYRRYLAMPPRKPPKITYPKFQYKSRSGPVTDEEIPAHLKLTRDNLNKKKYLF